jgi:hypothetical protein
MEPTEAYEVTTEWVQSHDGVLLHQAGRLSSSVTALLARIPAGSEFAIERHEDRLSDVFLTRDTSIWRVGVTDERVDVALFPLTPATARLTLSQRYEVRQRGFLQEQVLTTHFRLRMADLDGTIQSFEFDGAEVLGGGFPGEAGPDRTERFGRAVAVALGWNA